MKFGIFALFLSSCVDISALYGKDDHPLDENGCLTTDVSCDDPCADSPWESYTATAQECAEDGLCYEVFCTNSTLGAARSCATVTTGCVSATITFCPAAATERAVASR